MSTITSYLLLVLAVALGTASNTFAKSAEGLDENNELKRIRIYPQKSKAMNLAFDITPAKYVTGLITEKGVCEASTDGLKKLFK